jgi:Family of unknown function (DUF5709)
MFGMTEPDTPQPPEDPELEGFPDTASEDSTAYDDPRHPSLADSPPALPADEPLGVGEYGVTPEEGRHDEPLSARLVREEHDVSADDPKTPADEELAEEVTAEEEVARAAEDADVFDAGPANDPTSAVSEYDTADTEDAVPRPVGRLVEQDVGTSVDTEGQSIAYDSEESEGLSAEEAAMHEVSGADVPYDE